MTTLPTFSEGGGKGLPQDILRPLRRAGLALLCFFLFVTTWAAVAQIATSVRVPGTIGSLRPDHDVQHDTGGRLAQIHVRPYQNVAEGDLLFTFDTTEIRLQLQALEAQATRLRSEIEETGRRLEEPNPEFSIAKPESPLGRSVYAVYTQQDRSYAARRDELTAQIASSEAQRLATGTERAALENIRTLLTERLERLAPLTDRGVVTEREIEQARESLMSTDARIAALDRTVLSLAQQEAAARIRAQILTEERALEMAETRSSDLAQLADVEAEIGRLHHRLAIAEVRAPISGQVTDLFFDSPGEIAPPRTVLARLGQPLDGAAVDLKIPPMLVDQVRLGQEGLVTLDSLPQRSLPPLHVVVTAVSPLPGQDEATGNQLYRAKAEIAPEDLALAKERLGDRFNLVTGMPVSVALAGESTTLGAFLTSPLTAMWQNAFTE